MKPYQLGRHSTPCTSLRALELRRHRPAADVPQFPRSARWIPTRSNGPWTWQPMPPRRATPRVGRSSSSRASRRRCSGNTKRRAPGSPTRATRACSTPRSSCCRSQAGRATWSVTPSQTRPGSAPRRVEDWAVPYWLVDTSFATMLLLLGAAQEGLGTLFFALQSRPGPLLARPRSAGRLGTSWRCRHRVAEQ